MNDNQKTYIELELKWNKRFSWLLARALMYTGVLFLALYFLKPILAQHFVMALFGSIAFFLFINILIFFRERKLKKML